MNWYKHIQAEEVTEEDLGMEQDILQELQRVIE